MVLAAPEQTVSIDVAPDDMLELHIPAGEVVIEGDAVGHATASLEIKCPEDSESCEKWAAGIDVVAGRDGKKVVLRVSEPAKMNSAVDVRMTLPRDNPVSVTMGYGVLEIRGLENHVAVVMKAGDLLIESPAEAIRSVRLAARFGDVTLEEAHHAESGRRHYLVGAQLNWHEGAGKHDVDARLRYGNVRVSLR